MYPLSFLCMHSLSLHGYDEEWFPDISFFTFFPFRKWSGVCRVRKHASYVLEKGFSLTLTISITGSSLLFVRDSESMSQQTLQGRMEISFWQVFSVNRVRVISGLCSVTQPWNSAAGDFKHLRFFCPNTLLYLPLPLEYKIKQSTCTAS